MTTLNTIIEEEKKDFDKQYGGQKFVYANEETIQDFLTTAMQRAYEAGKAENPLKGERNRIIEQIREERDTYWKERVREEVEFMASKTIWNAEGKPHISAPDLLQALDNLK